jgi:hypothetical protein
MKNVVGRLLVIGIALAGAAAIYAQSKTVTADVPFNFYMGSKVMPQGPYRVSEMSDGGVIVLRTKAASSAITAFDVSGKSLDEPARLVFRRYGETYFLSQIWIGGTSTGRALPRSPREKELAENGPAPTLAVIRLSVR